MFRKLLFSGFVCAAVVFMGCNSKSNPASPSDTPAVPTGTTALFSDGFGGDLSKYESQFMLAVDSFYSPMRITIDAAHSGTHSLTTDSNKTALCYEVTPRPESGIVGFQWYMMAKSAGSINFAVSAGQNAGSSGGLSKNFGFAFDSSNVIKATYHDVNYGMFGEADTVLGTIQFNHWYKCRVEVNLADMTTDSAVVYYLDDAKVYHMNLPTIEMYGIDRVLAFRGYGAEGPKQYYVDDMVLYKK